MNCATAGTGLRKVSSLAIRRFHPSSIGMCAATATRGSGQLQRNPTFRCGLARHPSQWRGSARSQQWRSAQRIDSNDQVIDNFSWKLNKHDLKFGFDFYRTTVTPADFDHNFRGRLSFSNTYDDEGNLLATGLQNFLAGDLTGGFQYFGNTARHTYENNFGFYAQDSFRIMPHLTLNYGIRWDYFGVMGEKNNLLSNVTNLDLTDETFTLTQVGQQLA